MKPLVITVGGVMLKLNFDVQPYDAVEMAAMEARIAHWRQSEYKASVTPKRTVSRKFNRR